jgi:PAS domain S-box-containing protein
MTRMRDLSTEQRFRPFAEHTTDYAIILIDVDGRIVEWSSGAEQLLGWAAKETLNQSCAMIFTPRDRAAGVAEAELQKASREGRAADTRWHMLRDGSRFFADGVVNSMYGPDGNIIGFGKILREASAAFKHRIAEQTTELEDEKLFLEAVLENTEDGIVACDAEGALTLFNGAAREFHGSSEAPLPFEKWAEYYNLYRPDGVTRLPVEEIPLFRALNGEKVQGAEIVIAPKNRARRMPYPAAGH